MPLAIDLTHHGARITVPPSTMPTVITIKHREPGGVPVIIDGPRRAEIARLMADGKPVARKPAKENKRAS